MITRGGLPDDDPAIDNEAYRDLARKHHEKAGVLLAGGGAEEARYACLELRMTLECLTYDLLRLYRDDVPDDVLAMWHAGTILNALVDTDPGVENGLEIKVAGEGGSFETPSLRWREERLKVTWAKKTYHALGHFVHERTFAELERGTRTDSAKIRDRAAAIHKELGHILDSSGWNLRMIVTSQMSCDCGGKATFAMSPTQRKSRARCGDCAADYEVRRSDEGDGRVAARRLGTAPVKNRS